MSKVKRIKTIATMAIPMPFILATVSCSTTWISWKRQPDQETKYEFIKDKEKAKENQYKVRNLEILLQSFQDGIINLEQINNHYELIALLKYLSHLFSTQPIYQWWAEKDWHNFHNLDHTGFFDQINDNLTLRFKIGFQVSAIEISYNLTSTLKTINNGFQEFKVDGKKAFDVAAKGVNKDNTPKDLIGVSMVGLPLVSNPLVRALLSYQNNFALKLGALTNLPETSFQSFVNLINHLDIWLNQIFNNQQIQTWVKAKDVKFSLEPDGHFNSKSLSDLTFFKAKFIYNILK